MRSLAKNSARRFPKGKAGFRKRPASVCEVVHAQLEGLPTKLRLVSVVP
jgi:hypothetical protein